MKTSNEQIFQDLCKQYNLVVRDFNPLWKIANISSPYIDDTCFILSYCENRDILYIPQFVTTDTIKVGYHENITYNEKDFIDRINMTYDIIKILKEKEVNKKLENIKNDF